MSLNNFTQIWNAASRKKKTNQLANYGNDFFWKVSQFVQPQVEEHSKNCFAVRYNVVVPIIMWKRLNLTTEATKITKRGNSLEKVDLRTICRCFKCDCLMEVAPKLSLKLFL